jgi:hypothetical protein
MNSFAVTLTGPPKIIHTYPNILLACSFLKVLTRKFTQIFVFFLPTKNARPGLQQTNNHFGPALDMEKSLAHDKIS